MLLAPRAGLAWVTLTGLGQGAGFALAMVYLADWAPRRPTPRGLSAMGFLIGYSVASLGPPCSARCGTQVAASRCPWRACSGSPCCS
jgi:CP family cyanate transporter-like MFS transporter